MTIELNCKKSIVKWIVDNPGYVYSQFTFAPEHKDEVLPTEKEFEVLTHDVESWSFDSGAALSNDEQALYPGATYHQKYIFEPLVGNLYAHIFLTIDDDILYVVVGT